MTMDIPYIPYFQTSRYRVQTMIQLADINRSLPAGRQERAADLGTGDGRIAIALTKAGAIVDAYELDDQRIKEAKENIEKEFSLSLSKGHPVIPDLIRDLENNDLDSPVKGTSVSRLCGNDKTITLPTILKKDFWYEDLSNYSIICCYPMPDIMVRLEQKLQEELRPGSRVLLNYFPFKHWKLEKTKDNIFLYKR